MKNILLTFAILSFAGMLHAQNPISWTFTAKKIADKTYEIHLTATPKPGWHIYSQTQPEDAIAIPTEFVFKKNPLVTLDGKVKEVGAMKTVNDKKLGISANQYSAKTDFVQVVKLKAKAKTKLMGSVTFQTCDDVKCLPPETVNFNISLQ